MYSHFVVPRGGSSTEGNGFNSIDGNAGRGATFIDGKSSASSQISIYWQLLPQSSHTYDFLHSEYAIDENMVITRNVKIIIDVFISISLSLIFNLWRKLCQAMLSKSIIMMN